VKILVPSYWAAPLFSGFSPTSILSFTLNSSIAAVSTLEKLHQISISKLN